MAKAKGTEHRYALLARRAVGWTVVPLDLAIGLGAEHAPAFTGALPAL